MSGEKINWDEATKEVKAFSFKGQEKEAKIVAIYDGDTCKAIFPLNGVFYKWTIRVDRIDTPELKTKNVLESQFGHEVRDILRLKLLDKIVKLKCGPFDKYGRLLAEIYVDGESMNQFLIDKKYAFEYDGGTKKLWEPYLNSIGYKLKTPSNSPKDTPVKKSKDPKEKKVPKEKKEKTDDNEDKLTDKKRKRPEESDKKEKTEKKEKKQKKPKKKKPKNNSDDESSEYSVSDSDYSVYSDDD